MGLYTLHTIVNTNFNDTSFTENKLDQSTFVAKFSRIQLRSEYWTFSFRKQVNTRSVIRDKGS